MIHEQNEFFYKIDGVMNTQCIGKNDREKKIYTHPYAGNYSIAIDVHR